MIFNALRHSLILLLLFVQNTYSAPLATEQAQAFKDLIKMKTSLVGNWSGKGQVYDENTGKIRTLKFQRNISIGPFPYTFIIEGHTEMENGTRIPGYEIMGVRADGAVVRQLLFQNGNSSYKEQMIINYAIKSDDEWSLTFLEYLEGGKGVDGPGVYRVNFLYSGDKCVITRSIAHGAAPGREWEVRAELQR